MADVRITQYPLKSIVSDNDIFLIADSNDVDVNGFLKYKKVRAKDLPSIVNAAESITYANLMASIAADDLIIGTFYKITDSTSGVSPLLVQAVGVDAIGYLAFDASNPLVTINYDVMTDTIRWSLNQTVAPISLGSLSATTPLSYNNTTGVFTISQSNTTTNGYLSSADWNTFNAKQNAGNYITALTGEATASGPVGGGSAAITLDNTAVIGKVLSGLNVTGGNVVSTDSILTAFGKTQNQINALVGGVMFQGVWDAATNNPALTSSVGTKGYYYVVNVAGSTNLNGITDWKVGDWAIFDGSAWQKVDNTDSVSSVFGRVGAVVAASGDYTTTQVTEGTNLYYTEARVDANSNVAANTAARHNAVTLGTANGLSLSTQQLSLGLSSASANGALSSTDWSTFSGKQNALGGTGIVKSTGGTISYLTDNSTNWNTAYNDSIVSAGVTGTSTKTLTLNQQDGGTVTASWSDADTGLTSVGLTMPSAFSVANSPLTANGTLAVTGAGVASQYVRGDGTLAAFPTTSGGGSSVSYYFNGGTNQGTIGGNTYYEMSTNAIIGVGADFNINADGYIAQFVTDANDPSLLSIPAGNWNFEMWFSASSGGGSPSFYLELYKYDGATLTLISSGSAAPEAITGGTAIDLYTTALAVPLTTLALTDRLAVRVYVNHSSKTITLHTQNGHLCQAITTFSTGLTALNGLTSQVQYLAVGTSGTDFGISSVTDTHTFNLPTASATNRGALNSTDWSVFNGKQNALTLTTTGTSGAATLVGATLNIPQYQAALTNPITGTGTTNYLPKFTGASALGNSIVQDNGTNVSVGASTNGRLGVRGTTNDSSAYAFEAANSSGSTLFLVRNDGIATFNNGTANQNTTISGSKVSMSRTSDAAEVVYFSKNTDLGAEGTANINGYNGIQFRTQGAESVKLTIAESGAATFSSSVTAAKGIFSSSTGETLTAQGTVGNWVANLSGSASTGNSYGLIVEAGTNSSDLALGVYSKAFASTLLTIRGDGLATFGSLSGTGDRMVISNASGTLSTQAIPSVGSGTTNYVSKWNGTTLTDSLFFSDADVAKTIRSDGYNVGLYLNLDTTFFALGYTETGDWENENIVGFKATNYVFTMGDTGFNQGTHLFIDDQNKIIKTASNSADKGLYLDFANDITKINNTNFGLNIEYGIFSTLNNIKQGLVVNPDETNYGLGHYADGDSYNGISGFQYQSSVITLGDNTSALSYYGSKLTIDLNQQIIKTQSNGQDKGLYINYPNNIYALGFTETGDWVGENIVGFGQKGYVFTMGHAWEGANIYIDSTYPNQIIKTRADGGSEKGLYIDFTAYDNSTTYNVPILDGTYQNFPNALGQFQNNDSIAFTNHNFWSTDGLSWLKFGQYSDFASDGGGLFQINLYKGNWGHLDNSYMNWNPEEGFNLLNYNGITLNSIAFDGSNDSKLYLDGYSSRIELNANRINYRALTTTQINALTASAQEGDVVYNVTLHKLCFYNGTSWQQLTSTAM